MADRILVMAAYLGILLFLGLRAGKKLTRRNQEDYFVASRSLPSWVMILTMAATNFSAFTVFGFAGAGWSGGYAFYPIMAFGTGFMALTFYIIGRPAWSTGRIRHLVTPPELVNERFGSRPLRMLFLAVMTAFTLPYLAMQPMAAGYALESMFGIPYWTGAILITAVMIIYTFFGGMRGVAWTDVLQGGMMIVLLTVAVVAVAGASGGLAAANAEVASRWPQLFSRIGEGGYLPGIWLGYMLLWFLSDPMFPQLFQRFFAAGSRKALSRTMTFYPLITGFLFLLPVTLGVLGRLAFPEMPEGAAPDRILPMLLGARVPGVLEALILTSGLAALMSTMDSQLLTLSSIFTRDLFEPVTGRKAPWWLGKVFVVVLALIGLAISFSPPPSFLALARETFTGLAVLFPVVIAALYWKRATAAGAIASIVAGELLVAFFHFGLLPDIGTLPVVPVTLVSGIVLVLVSLLQSKITTPLASPGRKRIRGWIPVFVVLFLLGNDFWTWHLENTSWLLGYPWWVWYHLGLCLLTSLLFYLFSRRHWTGSS